MLRIVVPISLSPILIDHHNRLIISFNMKNSSHIKAHQYAVLANSSSMLEDVFFIETAFDKLAVCYDWFHLPVHSFLQ